MNDVTDDTGPVLIRVVDTVPDEPVILRIVNHHPGGLGSIEHGLLNHSTEPPREPSLRVRKWNASIDLPAIFWTHRRQNYSLPVLFPAVGDRMLWLTDEGSLGLLGCLCGLLAHCRVGVIITHVNEMRQSRLVALSSSQSTHGVAAYVRVLD